MKNEAASFLLAVQFLTRLPVGSQTLYSPERMAAAVRYYPLVGLLIGDFAHSSFFAADIVFPTPISVLLSMSAGVLITGAFHEDGLADTFDGIGGGVTRAKTLEIMKDSRLGTYGTIALALALALKAAALMTLSPSIIPLALIAAHCLSRLSSVLVIATSRYVRDHGTGKPVAGGASMFSLLIVVLTGGCAAWIWLIWQSPGALACAGGGLLIGHFLMRMFFEPKLKGYTGDTLGAVQQISEIGFYLGLVAWL